MPGVSFLTHAHGFSFDGIRISIEVRRDGGAELPRTPCSGPIPQRIGRRFSSDAYGGRTRSANSPDKAPEVSALLFFIILSDRKMQAKRNPSRALLRETGSNCLFARLLQGSLPEGLWMRSERASRRPWSTTGRKPGSAARILTGGLWTARSEPRYKPFRRRSGRWR